MREFTKTLLQNTVENKSKLGLFNRVIKSISSIELFVVDKDEYQEIVREQIEKGLHRIVVLGKYKGKKAVFRQYSNKTIKSKQFFNRELTALKELDENGFSVQPNLLDFSIKDLWLLESYVAGEVSGNFFNFSKKFVDRVKPKTIIKYLTELNVLTPSLPKYSSKLIKEYEQKIEYIVDHWPFDKNEIYPWATNFRDYLKRAVKEVKFWHSDINVGNIITRGGKIYLIDWESARYDIPFKDLAAAYYRAADFPSWQNDFLSNLTLNQQDMVMFDYVYMLYLCEDICFLNDRVGNKKYTFREGDASETRIKEIIRRNHRIVKKLV
ncbi:MAG: phosphotransferase [Candidatus Berkelbacteria bacterium]